MAHLDTVSLSSRPAKARRRSASTPPTLPARAKSAAKIIPFDEAAPLFAGLHAAGKVLVHCHGTFHMLHPAHVVHFEEAKALGDILVVTITGEKFVNKGPGRPYFNDPLRSRWLAALGCVDYVAVVPHPAAVEAIE